MRTLYKLHDERERKSKLSIVALLREIPAQVTALVKLEIAQLKAELKHKAINAGIGIGLLLLAAFLGFFAFAVLIAAAVLGVAVALPAWLAALIIGGALLLLTVILALIGLRSLKKAMPPKPDKSLTSVKMDIHAIKGTGRYDRRAMAEDRLKADPAQAGK